MSQSIPHASAFMQGERCPTSCFARLRRPGHDLFGKILLRGCIFSVLASVLALLLTGCLPFGSRSNKAKNNDSVVTSIAGIATQDRNRQGVQFSLICNGTRYDGGSIKDDFVTFDLANAPATAECSMEIRADNLKDNPNFRWYGRRKKAGASTSASTDFEFDKGLLYGSNKANLANKQLSLTLYRTYAELNEKDNFSATYAVRLRLNGAVMPEVATAQLACDGQSSSFPGVYSKATAGAITPATPSTPAPSPSTPSPSAPSPAVPTPTTPTPAADNDAVLTFDKSLPVLALQNKSCSKLAILVDNREAFVGQLVGFSFGAVDAGQTYAYPFDKTQRYELLPSTGSSIGNAVTLLAGKACLQPSADQWSCLDKVGPIPAKWDKRYLLAKVYGAKKSALTYEAVENYLVTAGNGMELHSGDFSVAALNANKAAFTWWRASAETALLTASFNEAALRNLGTLPERQIIDPAFEVMHIEWVKVHGFHDVTPAELNSPTRSNARWLVTLKKASDTSSTPQQFIATGPSHFASASKAVDISPTEKAFFRLEEFMADLKADRKDRFAAYSVTGGLMAGGCSATLADYVRVLSQQTDSNISIPSAGLCHVGKTEVDTANVQATDLQASGWQVWEWFTLQ